MGKQIGRILCRLGLHKKYHTRREAEEDINNRKPWVRWEKCGRCGQSWSEPL